MQDFIRSTIKEAGEMAKEYFYHGVSRKAKANLGDLVTEADVAVSNFLIDKIHKQYPTHHIHTEEASDDINPGAQYEWVIDPIDGTRNFATGIPFWCNMISVLKDGEVFLAAIYNPIANELFFAEKGKGSFCNEKQMRVNNVESLDYSFGHVFRGDYDVNTDMLFRKALSNIINNTSVWTHNFGNMLGACYIAKGSIDFYVNNTGQDHDYLPVSLICKEAGAIVTDSSGNEWKRDRRDIIISNPKLHSKVLKLFKI